MHTHVISYRFLFLHNPSLLVVVSSIDTYAWSAIDFIRSYNKYIVEFTTH